MSIDVLFNPTDEHRMLRDMVATFTSEEVEPQAEKFDREQVLNRDLFTRLGDLGLLGITVPSEDGGAGIPIGALTA